MIKLGLLLGAIVLVGIGLYFLIPGLRREMPEISSEIIGRLKAAQPQLSKDEENLFNLIEKNAVSGGPPKDGIPAIEKPKYTSAAEADQWLLPNDIVFGVAEGDFIVAYPQRILVWHEIVNETIGGEKVLVTYCPLTGTTIGFKGLITEGVSSTFGVSGMLINSNLIMYDRLSDSRWPQVLGRAYTGPASGIRLAEFPIAWTTWEKWEKKHPQTKVLARETGFLRNYGERGDPYGSYLRSDGGYYTSDSVIFSLLSVDQRLSPKTVVVGVRDEKGNALAVLKDRLRNQKVVEASLGEETVILTYKEDLDFYEARLKGTNQIINAFDAMWFAWAAFYPQTALVR